LIPIIIAIVVATYAGIAAERRYPDRAIALSRRSLLTVLYVVLPPTTFFNLAAVDFDTDHAGGIAIGWVATAAAAATAGLIGAKLLRLARPQVGAMMVCTLVANTGYLGYPLVAALLGSDSLGEGVAYDIGVGAPALLLGGFAVGAAFGTRAGSGARERSGAFFARNLPLYAGVLALLAPDSLAPDILVDISRVIVVAILPVGFFAVGTALAQESDEGEVRLPPPITRATLGVMFSKVMLLPVLLYAISLPLIDLPGTYLLMAAMPSGLNSMIVAHAYGLDLETTAEAISWTTALVVLVALVASFV
jgi:malate permease and related proteins